MQINSELVVICERAGRELQGKVSHKGEPVKGSRLMLTIAGLESDFGRLREFVRMEPGYAPGGSYYNKSEEVRKQFRRWGCLASSSFGTFQIMFIVAHELGYHQHPIMLQEDSVSGYWASQLIQTRSIKRGAKTLEDVLDSYNSGSFGDRNVPVAYIEKGIKIFEDLQGI